MKINHPNEQLKLTFWALALRLRETETSIVETLYGAGPIYIINSVRKPIIL